MSHKILLIGPKPPAIGGIASIVSLLEIHLTNIEVLDSSKPTSFFSKFSHPVMLAWRIILFCVENRHSKLLFFSSAYRSFWEKCGWALIGRIFRANVFVVMVDGNFPEFYSGISELKKWLARYFMTGVTVVAQSQSWKLFFQDIFPASKIQIVTGGVDTDFFKPAINRDSSGILRVLYVGWIIKEKGIYDILEACAHLKNSLNFRVELVGPVFCDRAKLEKIINSEKLEDFVTIYGPIHSREALREKYRSSDVFLFPSYYEGFPMALLEALACGVPAISTNVGGIPDILDYGRCGPIIEPGRPEEISAALQDLLTDEKVRVELGIRSRERAVKEFSISVSVGSYKQVLELSKE